MPADNADPHGQPLPTPMRERVRRVFAVLLPAAMLALVGWALYTTLARHGIGAIVDGLQAIPATHVWAAIAMTVVSFLLLVAIDRLAVAYAARVAPPQAPLPRVSLGRVAFSSFIAYAFGHSLGFSMFTGTALRYRSYSLCGMSALQVANIAVFCSITTGLGLLGAMSIGVLWTHDFVHNLPVPDWSVLLLAGAAAAVVLGYLVWSAQTRGALRWHGFALAPPGTPIAVCQVLLAAAEVCAMAGVLWVLLPDGAPGFLAFGAVFATALFVGLVSQVPGGIGVFEVAVLMAMPQIPVPALAGALLAYRAVYYVLPLVVAALALLVHEVAVQRSWMSKALGRR